MAPKRERDALKFVRSSAGIRRISPPPWDEGGELWSPWGNWERAQGVRGVTGLQKSPHARPFQSVNGCVAIITNNNNPLYIFDF